MSTSIRTLFSAAAASALLASGLSGSAALAQTPAPTPAATPPVAATPTAATTPSADDIKQRAQELEAARQRQKDAAELQEKLKAEIAAIGQDRSKLNQELIDIAAKVRNVESRIADAESRLGDLDTREQAIRGSLQSRRAEIVEVLAALQRAGRRTPPRPRSAPERAAASRARG